MSEKFYTILTTIGKNKLANSAVLGSKVNFKTLKIGNGNGAYYEPSENQTSLIKKTWEGNINSISIDELNTNWIVIETIIPATDGGFFIREAGIFDEEGDLIAVSKISETYKPVISEGSTKDISIKIILEVSNVDTVTLKIDPNVTLATKNDIEILESKIQETSTQLSESANILIPTTGSAANAILLNIPTLSNNKKYSFKASATSNGNVTINGKAFKKLDGTQISSGGIKVNKVYDFYYDSAADSVFILAKAEGDATVDNVLATKGFSNGDDTGLVGTMPNNGAVNQSLAINGAYTIPTGYHNGSGKVTQNVATKAAATITPGTTDQVVAANQYLSGAQTIKGDTNLLASNIIIGKTIFGVAGTATAKTLGGYSINDYVNADDLSFNIANIWTDPSYINIQKGVFDSSGNLYTVGSDHYIRKFNSMGVLQWSYNAGSILYDIAIDSNRNVYTVEDSFTVRKINSSGVQVWAYTDTTVANNWLYAVTLDSEGNVYAGGSLKTVTKLNASGVKVWAYGAPSGILPRCLVADTSNNIFMVSGSYGATSNTVRKINSSGVLVANTLTANWQAIAIDGSNNIYGGAVNMITKYSNANLGTGLASLATTETKFMIYEKTKDTLRCGSTNSINRYNPNLLQISSISVSGLYGIGVSQDSKVMVATSTGVTVVQERFAITA